MPGVKQQIINNHVEDLSISLHTDTNTAFLIYGHTLVMGEGPASFEMDDIVDGGQDKQIDAISIIETEGRADIYITQATTTDGFSSNKLIQLRNGLKWLLEVSRNELKNLPNESLRDKILQFREIQSELGPSNLNIHVSFIANSDTAHLSDEFISESRNIENEYSNDVFERFSLNVIGIDELTSLAKLRDRRVRSVDADLKIKYDMNTASVINYFSQGLKGAVCTVPATEIAKLVNQHPDGAIFDLNIRQYLGARGSVNKEIQSTASGDDSHEFWFLNNGITIVCDKFDIVQDPDNPKLKVTNLQIVNGCQTASTLGGAAQSGDLKKDVNVIVRVYETKDENLVGKIVLTTNNQNQITSRNLRANDPMQISMEDAFKIKNYKYERKPRQYANAKNIDKIYTNEEVGQAFLAGPLKNPADARSRRYKIWAELNKQVFSGAPVEQYILSALVVRRLSQWLRKSSHHKSKDTDERILAKRGLYHVSRVALFEVIGSDNWSDTTKLAKIIDDIENNNLKLDAIFEKAFRITKSVFDAEFKNDVERGIKSYSINTALNKKLHK